MNACMLSGACHPPTGRWHREHKRQSDQRVGGCGSLLSHVTRARGRARGRHRSRDVDRSYVRVNKLPILPFLDQAPTVFDFTFYFPNDGCTGNHSSSHHPPDDPPVEECCRNGTEGREGLAMVRKNHRGTILQAQAMACRSSARVERVFARAYRIIRERRTPQFARSFKHSIRTRFLCAYSEKPSPLSRFTLKYLKSYSLLYLKPSPRLSLNHRKPSQEIRNELKTYFQRPGWR